MQKPLLRSGGLHVSYDHPMTTSLVTTALSPPICCCCDEQNANCLYNASAMSEDLSLNDCLHTWPVHIGHTSFVPSILCCRDCLFGEGHPDGVTVRFLRLVDVGKQFPTIARFCPMPP